MDGARLGRKGIQSRDLDGQGRAPLALLPHLLPHRLLEAGRRLSGRGRERHPGGVGEAEVDEEGDDGGHRRGLAGAGPPGHDAEPMAKGGAGRRTRAVVRKGGLGEEPIDRGRRIGRRIGGGGRKPEEAGGGLALRGPEAVEVEPAVTVEDEGPAFVRPRPGHHRARRERFEPGGETREWRGACLRPAPPRDLRQGDAGVSAPRPGAREGGRDGNFRPAPSVEVRRHRPEMPVDVRDVALAAKLVEARDGHAPSPRKSRSSPCTKEAAGRSNQTPRFIPATGSMPRTKR